MNKDQFMKKYPEGMTFDVLGTTYTLHYDEELCEENDARGLAELYSKKIIISLKGYDNKSAYENVEEFYKKTLRHEIIHAYFHEMGLSEYCSDETLVDCLAIQSPKIFKLMKGIL